MDAATAVVCRATTKQKEQSKKMALHNFTVRANSDDLEMQLSALATDCFSSRTMDLMPDVAIGGLAAGLNHSILACANLPSTPLRICYYCGI